MYRGERSPARHEPEAAAPPAGAHSEFSGIDPALLEAAMGDDDDALEARAAALDKLVEAVELMREQLESKRAEARDRRSQSGSPARPRDRAAHDGEAGAGQGLGMGAWPGDGPAPRVPQTPPRSPARVLGDFQPATPGSAGRGGRGRGGRSDDGASETSDGAAGAESEDKGWDMLDAEEVPPSPVRGGGMATTLARDPEPGSGRPTPERDAGGPHRGPGVVGGAGDAAVRAAAGGLGDGEADGRTPGPRPEEGPAAGGVAQVSEPGSPDYSDEASGARGRSGRDAARDEGPWEEEDGYGEEEEEEGDDGYGAAEGRDTEHDGLRAAEALADAAVVAGRARAAAAGVDDAESLGSHGEPRSSGGTDDADADPVPPALDGSGDGMSAREALRRLELAEAARQREADDRREAVARADSEAADAERRRAEQSAAVAAAEEAAKAMVQDVIDRHSLERRAREAYPDSDSVDQLPSLRDPADPMARIRAQAALRRLQRLQDEDAGARAAGPGRVSPEAREGSTPGADDSPQWSGGAGAEAEGFAAEEDDDASFDDEEGEDQEEEGQEEEAEEGDEEVDEGPGRGARDDSGSISSRSSMDGGAPEVPQGGADSGRGSGAGSSPSSSRRDRSPRELHHALLEAVEHVDRIGQADAALEAMRAQALASQAEEERRHMAASWAAQQAEAAAAAELLAAREQLAAAADLGALETAAELEEGFREAVAAQKQRADAAEAALRAGRAVESGVQTDDRPAWAAHDHGVQTDAPRTDAAWTQTAGVSVGVGGDGPARGELPAAFPSARPADGFPTAPPARAGHAGAPSMRSFASSGGYSFRFDDDDADDDGEGEAAAAQPAGRPRHSTRSPKLGPGGRDPAAASSPGMAGYSTSFLSLPGYDSRPGAADSVIDEVAEAAERDSRRSSSGSDIPDEGVVVLVPRSEGDTSGGEIADQASVARAASVLDESAVPDDAPAAPAEEGGRGRGGASPRDEVDDDARSRSGRYGSSLADVSIVTQVENEPPSRLPSPPAGRHRPTLSSPLGARRSLHESSAYSMTFDDPEDAKAPSVRPPLASPSALPVASGSYSMSFSRAGDSAPPSAAAAAVGGFPPVAPPAAAAPAAAPSSTPAARARRAVQARLEADMALLDAQEEALEQQRRGDEAAVARGPGASRAMAKLASGHEALVRRLGKKREAAYARALKATRALEGVSGPGEASVSSSTSSLALSAASAPAAVPADEAVGRLADAVDDFAGTGAAHAAASGAGRGGRPVARLEDAPVVVALIEALTRALNGSASSPAQAAAPADHATAPFPAQHHDGDEGDQPEEGEDEAEVEDEGDDEGGGVPPRDRHSAVPAPPALAGGSPGAAASAGAPADASDDASDGGYDDDFVDSGSVADESIPDEVSSERSEEDEQLVSASLGADTLAALRRSASQSSTAEQGEASAAEAEAAAEAEQRAAWEEEEARRAEAEQRAAEEEEEARRAEAEAAEAAARKLADEEAAAAAARKAGEEARAAARKAEEEAAARRAADEEAKEASRLKEAEEAAEAARQAAEEEEARQKAAADAAAAALQRAEEEATRQAEAEAAEAAARKLADEEAAAATRQKAADDAEAAARKAEEEEAARRAADEEANEASRLKEAEEAAEAAEAAQREAMVDSVADSILESLLTEALAEVPAASQSRGPVPADDAGAVDEPIEEEAEEPAAGPGDEADTAAAAAADQDAGAAAGAGTASADAPHDEADDGSSPEAVASALADGMVADAMASLAAVQQERRRASRAEVFPAGDPSVALRRDGRPRARSPGLPRPSLPTVMTSDLAPMTPPRSGASSLSPRPSAGSAGSGSPRSPRGREDEAPWAVGRQSPGASPEPHTRGILASPSPPRSSLLGDLPSLGGGPGLRSRGGGGGGGGLSSVDETATAPQPDALAASLYDFGPEPAALPSPAGTAPAPPPGASFEPTGGPIEPSAAEVRGVRREAAAAAWREEAGEVVDGALRLAFGGPPSCDGVVRIDLDALGDDSYLRMESDRLRAGGHVPEADQIRRKLVFDVAVAALRRAAAGSATARLALARGSSTVEVSRAVVDGVRRSVADDAAGASVGPAAALSWGRRTAERTAQSALDQCRARPGVGDPRGEDAPMEEALGWVCSDVGDGVVRAVAQDAAEALLDALEARRRSHLLEPYTWRL